MIKITAVLSVLGAPLAGSVPQDQAEPAVEVRELFGEFLRHDAVVRDVEWAAGGLLTLDSSGRLQQWSERSGAAVATLDLPGCVDVAAHAGGGRSAGLAIAHGSDPRVVDWRPSLQAEPLWSATGLTGPLAIDAAGEVLAAVGGEWGAARVELVQLANGERRSVLEFGSWELRGLELAAGELAVLGFNRNKALGRDGTESEPVASLWRIGVADGGELARVNFDWQPTLLLRAEGRWIVGDPSGRLWAGDDAEAPGQLSGVSADAPLLMAIDTPSGAIVQVDRGGRLGVRTALGEDAVERGRFGPGAAILAADPRAPRVAVASGTAVGLVELAGEAPIGGAAGFTSIVSSLSFDASGTRLLASSYDHSVRVIDVADGSIEASFPTVGIVHAADWFEVQGEPARVTWIARGGALEQRALDPTAELAARGVAAGAPWTDLATHGDQVVAAFAEGGVQSARSPDLRPAWASDGPRGTVQRVALVPGRAVIGASGLVVLELERGKRLGELGDMGAPVESLAGAAAAPRAAVGLASGAVGIVDTDAIEVVATAAQHLGRVRAVALSPDGRRLASVGTNDGAITLTSLDEAGAAIGAVKLNWPDSRCTALAFGPDGRTLAAGGLDGDLRVFVLGD